MSAPTPETVVPAAPAGRSAVFLDRDGTIIFDRHYLCDPAGVELLPLAAAGLKRMQALGLPLVLVSNQSGVGRGYFGLHQVEQVNARLAELLAAQGVRLDGAYFCPHTPEDACSCRKPQPGLIHRAALDLGINPALSFMVGDKPCDVELGQAVSAVTFLVPRVPGSKPDVSCRPDWLAGDLDEVAARIEDVLRHRCG